MATTLIPKRVKLADIVRLPSLCIRVAQNDEIVRQYADLLIEGTDFPPLELVLCNGNHYLADGNLRYEAYAMIGSDEVSAFVREGTLAEALVLACQANIRHGLPLTRHDKRRVIQLMVEQPEWADASDNLIANACGVDHKTVAATRADLGIPKNAIRRTASGRPMDISAIGKSAKKQNPNIAPQNEPDVTKSPAAWPEFDHTIADDVPQASCPHCGHALPVAWMTKVLGSQAA